MKKLMVIVVVLAMLVSGMQVSFARDISETATFETSAGYTLNGLFKSEVSGGSWFSFGEYKTGDVLNATSIVKADPLDSGNQVLEIKGYEGIAVNALNLGHNMGLTADETVFIHSFRIYPADIQSGMFAPYFSGVTGAAYPFRFIDRRFELRNDTYENGAWNTAKFEYICSNYEKKWYDMVYVIDTSDSSAYKHTLYVDGEKYGPYTLSPGNGFTPPNARFRAYPSSFVGTIYLDDLAIATPATTLSLVKSSPEAYAIANPENGIIELEFNDYIDSSSLSSISVSTSNGTVTPSSIKAEGKKVEIKLPLYNMEYLTEYIVNYTGVKSIFNVSASGSLYFTTSTEPAPEFTLSELNILDLKGNALSEIPENSSFIAEVSAMKTSDSTEPAFLIIALFNEDNQLVDTSYMSGSFPADYEIHLGTTIKQSADNPIKKAKAFVWDSLLGLTPYSNTVSFPIAE